MNRQFNVLAYKAQAGSYYGAAGQRVPINCDHSVIGDFGMNPDGQILDLPPEAVVTGGAKAVLVPPATGFPTVNEPNLSLTAVKLIKDNVLQTAYYVDATDYASAVVVCNPIPYASACPGVTDLAATPGTTDADISWTETPGIVGVEYANLDVDVEPSSGTFLAAGTGTVNVTGLTTTTTYYFFVRTICTGAVTSAWSRVEYDTL